MSDRFVSFTRLDGRPIWLNASFIVTVEPGDNGGAVVVPIGDGLDYDVKESPEQVLAALGCAEVAKVVPVPVSDALARPQAERLLRARHDLRDDRLYACTVRGVPGPRLR